MHTHNCRLRAASGASGGYNARHDLDSGGPGIGGAGGGRNGGAAGLILGVSRASSSHLTDSTADVAPDPTAHLFLPRRMMALAAR
jgi:hypothetical protein